MRLKLVNDEIYVRSNANMEDFKLVILFNDDYIPKKSEDNSYDILLDDYMKGFYNLSFNLDNPTNLTTSYNKNIKKLDLYNSYNIIPLQGLIEMSDKSSKTDVCTNPV